MSTQASATAPSHGTTNGVSHDLELDVPKLHSLSSEQQDLYLLTFTAHLTHHVSSLDKEAISDQQLQIKKELFKIVTLSSPQPSRVIRNNLGKCFREVLGRGNRSTLYETINELLGLLGPGKSEKELRLKHAAAHCLGEVYAAAGESAVSLSGFSCSGLIKTLKGAQNYTGLRASIYKALGKVVTGAGSGVDETTAREIWKYARGTASADKSFLVQSSACWCLEQLAVSTLFFENSNDFDTLKTTIWKAIETPASVVRRAAASCLAATLVKSYSEEGARDAVPKIWKPKKPSKKHSTAIEDGEDIERPSSPSPKKAAVQLSLSLREILRQLSFQYLRQSVGPKGRAGIASCYQQVLVRLNGKVVEEQYSQIASHFFVDLLSHPAITFNRYRLLLTRKLVKHLLEEVVGRRILGEGSQLNAVRWLVNDVLKNYPQAIQDRPEPGKHTLTASLSALASLLSSLGSAVAILGDACRDGLLQVLQHPSYTVQIHTSYCLRNFVLAYPQQLLSCLTICINSINRELNNLGGQRHSPRRCVGYANGLAAMLSTSRLQPLYGSVDVYSRVLSLATELLKSSSSSELRVSATQVQVAWILIGGLMPLGPSFVKIHLAQLLLLWKNALPRPLTKDNMAQRGNLEMSFLTHVRECALGSILAFLEFNSRLVTTDGSKRIANMLQNTIMFLESLPPQRSTEDISQRLSPSLQLHDLTMMVRRRVLQCYSKLVQLTHLGHSEVLSQSNLLSLALSSFADPDSGSHKTLEASLANSASSFESLWDVADNWGSGVTGMVRGFRVKALAEEHSRGIALVTATINSERDAIDESVSSFRDQGCCLIADAPSWCHRFARQESTIRFFFTASRASEMTSPPTPQRPR
jgi:HEAT repeat-containing protein 5